MVVSQLDILLTYDYSPFGVILKERNFEKQIASDSTWIDTVQVINDNFNSGTTQGWNVLSGSTSITNVNSTLAISKSGGSNDVGVYKQFIAQDCMHYYFSAFVDKGNCNSASQIEITITDNMANPIYQTTLGSGNGTFTFDFVASSTGAYTITFERIGNNSSCTFYVDDVKLYYVEEMTYCILNAYNSYRYGFNGMEKDDEVKGSGNSYDFGARMYDSRLGRWLSIDKYVKEYSPFSPYSHSFNNPIYYIDADGNVIWDPVNNREVIVTFDAKGKPSYLLDNGEPVSNEFFKGSGLRVINVLSTSERGRQLVVDMMNSPTKIILNIPNEKDDSRSKASGIIPKTNKSGEPKLFKIGKNKGLFKEVTITPNTKEIAKKAENAGMDYNELFLGVMIIEYGHISSAKQIQSDQALLKFGFGYTITEDPILREGLDEVEAKKSLVQKSAKEAYEKLFEEAAKAQIDYRVEKGQKVDETVFIIGEGAKEKNPMVFDKTKVPTTSGKKYFNKFKK